MAIIDLIKRFDKSFHTKFHQKENLKEFLSKKKKELKLNNLNPQNILIILTYSYLKENGFMIDNEFFEAKLDKKSIVLLKKSFRNPIIYTSQKGDFLLIITKKGAKEVSWSNLEKLSKIYNGSDIIYINRKDNRLVYTKGDATQKIKKLIREEKISVLPLIPKKVTIDLFEKIINSNKFDIFEVEFRHLNFPALKGLYIKTGSKQDKINSKIKEILKIFLRKAILRVSNIKSIHFGLKNCKREDSASLVISVPKALGTYQIRWKGSPCPELAFYVREEVLKGVMYVDLIDNTSYLEHLISNLLGRTIYKKIYQQRIKDPLSKWDKYKLIEYNSNKLKPNFSRFEELLRNTFSVEYIVSEEEIILDSKTKRKGFLLRNKKTGKEIFVFLNKRNTPKNILEKLINNKQPVLVIDFYSNIIDQEKRYNFLNINEEKIEGLIKKVIDICNQGIFYRDQKNRFLNAKNSLNEAKNKLKRLKTSQSKGSFWEKICEDILDYILNRTFKLSGPNLPDGRTYFDNGTEGFIWDAKALLKTDLSKSILDKQKKPKDLAYISVFRRQMKMDFYIYLSYGVTKEEFLEAKLILEKKYKSKTKFVCITEDALQNLADIFGSEERATMLHKNNSIFIKNLKKIFLKEYIEKITLEEITKDMILPDKIKSDKALRKEVKVEKTKLNPLI